MGSQLLICTRRTVSVGVRYSRLGTNVAVSVLGVSAARVSACHHFATEPDFSCRTNTYTSKYIAANAYLGWFGRVMIWSAVENHVAIFVTCAPSIKVITLHVFPRLKSTYYRTFSRSSWSRTAYDSQASGARKSDKMWTTMSNTPLPSPALTAGSRRSLGFRQLLRSPTSPRRLESSDDMEHALVDIENAGGNDKYWEQERGRTDAASPHKDTDIRVEHTIDVQSLRESRDDEVCTVGKAS